VGSKAFSSFNFSLTYSSDIFLSVKWLGNQIAICLVTFSIKLEEVAETLFSAGINLSRVSLIFSELTSVNTYWITGLSSDKSFCL